MTDDRGAKESRGAAGVAYVIVAAAVFIAIGVQTAAIMLGALALGPLAVVVYAVLGVALFIVLALFGQSRGDKEDQYYFKNVDQ